MASTYHDLNRIIKESVTIDRDTRDYSNSIVFSNQNNIFKGGFIGTLSTTTGKIVGDNILSGVEGLCSYVKVLHQDIVTERQERIEADYDVTKIRQEIEQTRIGLSTDYSQFKESISSTFATKENLTSEVQYLTNRINEKTTYSEVKNSLSNDGYATKTEITNKANWDTAYSLSHKHDNLNILSGISQNDINNWNNAKGSSHSHSNKDNLDKIDNTKLALSTYEEIKNKLNLEQYALSTHNHSITDIVELSNITINRFISCDVSDVAGDNIAIQDGTKLSVHNYTSSDFNTAFVAQGDSEYKNKSASEISSEIGLSNYQLSGNYIKCSVNSLSNTFEKVKMSGTYRDGNKETFEFYILTSTVES